MPTPVRPYARAVLVVAVALVAVGGLQLYVFAERTDELFAWTIKAPITAAFLGAGFLAALPSFVLALRAREWQRVRVVFVVPLAFALVMLGATLRHLSAFHFDEGPTSARVAAWAWLGVYAVIPAALAGALVAQELAGGRYEYRVERPLLQLTRWVLLAHAVPLAMLGLGLAVWAPDFDGAWPWPLPELSANAVAAWLLAVAVGASWAFVDPDWRRLRILLPALLGFPLLLLAAALRFRHALPRDEWKTWAYVALLTASVVAVAASGWQQERLLRAEELDAEAAPRIAG